MALKMGIYLDHLGRFRVVDFRVMVKHQAPEEE
jgi:hypothetical protein